MKQIIHSLATQQVVSTFVKGIFGATGRYITPQTNRKDLSRLIRKLHPISSGCELIRLGPKSDGGYLVPNDFHGIDACFSPGVNNISGFEEACVEQGMRVFLADKSVNGPASNHKNFNFYKKYVGAIESDDFMTLDNWVNASLPNSKSDLLLQIDIENYEYETFLSVSNNLMNRFRIIVAEFHDLPHLWSAPFFKLGSRVFEKILHTHTCVHIHPNNRMGFVKHDGLIIPYLLEFTFLRSDRINNQGYANLFPHPLDVDNTSRSPMTLPECWYGGN